ncbi:hypothetical protein [Lactobacillus delbrueckii]|uniref:hypothetical protein n=1 Tax=Lactobacillus delbrueckii TaxID=1584 RepID=UPI0011D13684|nr:hypothetical protein [Lactobacillus delbrueckii]
MQLLDAEVAGIAAAVDPVFAVVVIPDVLEKVFSIFAACQALVRPGRLPSYRRCRLTLLTVKLPVVMFKLTWWLLKRSSLTGLGEMVFPLKLAETEKV